LQKFDQAFLFSVRSLPIRNRNRDGDFRVVSASHLRLALFRQTNQSAPIIFCFFDGMQRFFSLTKFILQPFGYVANIQTPDSFSKLFKVYIIRLIEITKISETIMRGALSWSM